MTVARSFRLGALLLLVAIPVSVPGLQTTSYGGWPAVGFATALFLAAGPTRRWHTLVALSVVTGIALSASYDVQVWLGVVGSTSLTLPAMVSAWLLDRRGHGRVPLDIGDLGSFFFVAAVAGAVCGVLGGIAVVSMEGAENALLTAFMSFLAAVTAQLVVLPLLFRASPAVPARGAAVELWVERSAMVLVLLVVFAPRAPLALAFLVFPLLGWAALRARRIETHAQMFVVALVAYASTFLGRGPFTNQLGGVPDELVPALLYLFIAAGCLLTIPVAMTVERMITMTNQATLAATTVERMLDSATGTVFIAADRDGRITHFNSGAEHTLGYTAHEVLGRSPRMFHSAEELAHQAHALGVDPPDYAAVVLAQVRSGERRDWAFLRSDGTTRMGSLSVTELSSPTGEVQGYIASGEDITERLRAQRAVEAALEHEHESVLRLQEVDDVKQELVSNVSHELRTPITSISGYTELLTDGELGELNVNQVDAVLRIGRNASRLGLLVDDLLTLSREEADDLVIAEEAVDLAAVVGETHDLMREFLRGRALDVRVVVPEQPVVVRGDAPALERVATNLLSNAVKFTPDGGRVSLGVEQTEHDAVLVVSDTGMGIPEEDREQLFTRFYRSSAATEQAIQGSGLGLSIVHAIVTRHGGGVTVESEPGAGTTVRATLPLLEQRRG